MRYTPHPYQQNAFRWIIDHPRCCLFLDMGLGKTVVTLTAFQWLQESLDVERCLVVAPKKVAETTWTSEASKWDHLHSLRVAKVMGSPAQRMNALDDDADIYVIGRDSFSWLCEHYSYRLPFDMLIIDELTSFKTHSSKRFKAMRKVTPLFSRVIGLTGTPAPNSLIDLWAQLYCIDMGNRLGKSLTRYRDEFFHLVRWNNIVIRCTPRRGAEDIIRRKIADICLSMQAKDYLQLPSLIVHDEHVELSERVLTGYQHFERDHVLDFLSEHQPDDEASSILADNAAALISKLSQYANGAIYDADRQVHSVHDEKLDRLEELVEAAASPVLIFYQYQHDIPRITARFKGHTVRLYQGEQDLLDWNAGKIDILLAHPASTAYGLNLQQGGHYIIWFGTGWNLELYQQANARLYRQGQQHPVIIYNLVCSGTVDERALIALRNKDSVQQKLLRELRYLKQKYQSA